MDFLKSRIGVLALILGQTFGTNIKWTPGPGPAPLPYSKRAREAMGYSDDDKPWAHPDDPIEGEGWLKAYLLVMVLAALVVYWAYHKISGGTNVFFDMKPTPSSDVKVSDESVREAREARLKRFDSGGGKYADMMREAMGGADTGEGAKIVGVGDVGGGDGGAAGKEIGLRNRRK